MAPSSFSPFRSADAREFYHAFYQERARSWPTHSETALTETPAGQTFVRIDGDPANPPLVLLPGSRDTSLMWSTGIGALSAHYRTYALDSIYDIGLSVARRRLSRPEHLVGWLDEVLNVLVPGEAVRLVGMSYGGWLAGQYALSHSQRVHKLAMLAPAATVLPVSPAFLARALTLALPGRLFIRRFLYWLLQDTVESGPAGRALVEQAAAEWFVAQRCFAPLPLIAATVVPDPAFRSLQIPTLFLDGEHEKVYSAQRALERLHRVAPHIQAGIIPQAGHDLWILRPEVVTLRLLNFLADRGTRDSENQLQEEIR